MDRVTTSELCRMAGVSRQAVHVWREKRKVPYQKKLVRGRYVYTYPRAAVERFLATFSEDVQAAGR